VNPPGLGARRLEVHEEHRIFHASTLYFCASNSHARRTASIGPGIYYSKTDIPNYDDDWDESSHANESAASPSRDASRSNNEISTLNQRAGDPATQISSSIPPSRPSFLNQRRNRHASADYYQLQRMSLYEPDEGLTDLHMQQLVPIPPYSPISPPVTSGSFRFHTMHGVNDASSHPPTSTTPSLEDFRHSLYSLRTSYRSQSKNYFSSKSTFYLPFLKAEQQVRQSLDVKVSQGAVSFNQNLTPFLALTLQPPHI